MPQTGAERTAPVFKPLSDEDFLILDQLVYYDRATGALRWRLRTPARFDYLPEKIRSHASIRWNSMWATLICGYFDPETHPIPQAYPILDDRFTDMAALAHALHNREYLDDPHGDWAVVPFDVMFEEIEDALLHFGPGAYAVVPREKVWAFGRTQRPTRPWKLDVLHKRLRVIARQGGHAEAAKLYELLELKPNPYTGTTAEFGQKHMDEIDAWVEAATEEARNDDSDG